MNDKVKKVIIISLLTGATMFHGSEKLLAKDYLANQSAEYHRTFSRNASIDSADIVNYNPAGTAFMADGLYINIGDQYIYHKLNRIEYEGEIYQSKVPANIPSAFAVYKKDKFAFFGAFTVPAGGGSVKYPDGFPMMDLNTTTVMRKAKEEIYHTVASGLLENSIYTAVYGSNEDDALNFAESNLNLDGTTVTWLGGSLEGSSMYLAGTAGLAVQADNKLSLSAGVRAVYAINKYKGFTRYLINPDAAYAYAGADLIASIVTNTAVGEVDDTEDVDKLVELDAEMTAFGLGQIIGIDYKPTDKLLLGFRYETATPLTWKEKVKDGKDFAGKYVDGRETHKDLPALIGVGAHYDLLSNLSASVSFVYYFYKDSDAGEDEGAEIFGYDDDYENPWDLTAAVEYKPFKWLLLSLGYSYTIQGGNEGTYSDTDHSLDSQTFGGGFALTVFDNLTINAAYSHCIFKDGQNVDGEKYHKEIDSAGVSVQYVFFTNSSSAAEDTDEDDDKAAKKKEKKVKKEKKEKKTE